MPVSANIVCLWIIAPKAYSQLELRPNGSDAKLELKRRLIVSGRRLHLFVFDAPGFSASSPNIVTFKAEQAASPTRVESIARLADWNSPLIGSVTRALVDALGEGRPRGFEATLLARFFGLVAAWRAPCGFVGQHGSFYVAAFEMGDFAEDIRHLIVVEGSSIRLEQVRVVGLGGTQCCLLWRDGPFDYAYLDTGSELLELAVKPRAQSAQQDFDAWFSGLAPESRGGVLDGWMDLANGESLDDLVDLDTSFPTGIPIGEGHEDWGVMRVIASADSLYLFLQCSAEIADRPPEIVLEFPGREPFQVLLRQKLTTGAAVLVYCSEISGEAVPHGPVRVTIVDHDRPSSQWFCLSSIEEVGTRRWLRENIPWHSADDKLVAELGVEMILAGARTPQPRFPEIEIFSNPDTPGPAPIFVCVHNGDLAALEMTLIGISLTAGTAAPQLRIIVTGEPTPADLQALYGLCRAQDIEATVVLVPEDQPIGPALALRSEDRSGKLLVYLSSGAVPRGANWWTALEQDLAKKADSVFVAPGDGPGASRRPSARDLLAKGGFVLAVGGKVAETVVDPRAEFQSAAGFLAHAMAAAERCRRAGDPREPPFPSSGLNR